MLLQRVLTPPSSDSDSSGNTVDQPSTATDDSIDATKKHEDTRILTSKCMQQFEAAMGDDLNAPKATAALFRLVGAAEALGRDRNASIASARLIHEAIVKMNEVLGILYEVPRGYITQEASGNELEQQHALGGHNRDEAVALAEERWRLKAAKQFAEADRVRDTLNELGFGVRDTAGGGFEVFDL